MARRPRLQIAGLVSSLNWARAQLAAGVPAAEVEAFRTSIRSTLATVERLCREAHCRPQDLPTPSYRAYLTLKGLDLARVPIRQADPDVPEGQAPAGRKFRISRMLSGCERVHAKAGAIARRAVRAGVPGGGGEMAGWLAGDEGFRDLLAEVRSEVEALDALLRKHSAKPSDLPTPSHRAYQWTRFLADSENLTAHVDTLVRVMCLADVTGPAKTWAGGSAGLAVRLTFGSHLYRHKVLDGRHQLILHEGFLGAGDDVLGALVLLAAGGRGAREAQGLMRRYARGESFAEVLTAMGTADLEAFPIEVGAAARGRLVDLDAVFGRVNGDYFANALPRPRLAWSQVLTHRKLGHYQWSTDTVMLSQTLDAPGVPVYVVDFVMYHELLHKQLGTRVVNGRRYAHTPEFRRAERRFRYFEEAEAWLRKIGGSWG